MYNYTTFSVNQKSKACEGIILGIAPPSLERSLVMMPSNSIMPFLENDSPIDMNVPIPLAALARRSGSVE